MDNSIFSIYNTVESPSVDLSNYWKSGDTTYSTNTLTNLLENASQSTSQSNTDPWSKFNFSDSFSNYQITGNETSKERLIKYKGVTRKLSEILNTLHKNEPTAWKHYCTRAVSNALETISDVNHASGIANPKCLYQALKADGWKDVYTNDYTPQAGDVWTYYESSDRMHSSMYDGEKWVSYDNEGKDPWFYKQNKKTKVGHIQRYVPKN